MRESLIKEKLTELNLTAYENILAGTYSGGNKRKLSVAIALLGNPPIVLLDEPSSGMDPEARRFMWSVVAKVTGNKSSSVILTTHSMEEAEALSTKLVIMVEGSVKCIGPVQALKNKYGKGFEIETKFEEINLILA
jgi:ATP-binding cassette, subfamily A (ABC1), member 3